MCKQVTDGVFYTDPTLARFAAWFARDLIPKGDYTLLDPCCGSGNLYLNNPFLGRPTVIASDLNPTIPNAIQANFLTISAKDYLDLLPPIDKTKPLLIFVNPPYRGDADQSAESIAYVVHSSFTDIIGRNGAMERCNCFITQLVNVVKQLNIPNQLILISKCCWLGSRATFQTTKNHLINHFEFNSGFIIKSKEFFKCKGRFPIAITTWKFNTKIEKPNEVIKVRDLTWLKKKDLDFFTDNHERDYDTKGESLLKDHKTTEIAFGVKRENLRKWSNMYLKDFVRDRRKKERGDPLAGGLPFNDDRRKNKKTYGESTGNFIGFMDDLTPCRIKKSVENAQPLQGRASAPWFHLNPQFMHVKINRCFSGPHNCRSYHAPDLDSAQKCFVWYALARTLQTFGYPMWADAEELWVPADTNAPLYSKLIDYAFALGFAENECVETVFPAHNPIQGAPEISISNPMTPNNPKSFWNTVMLPSMTTKMDLINAVNAIFKEWASRFKDTSEIVAPFQKPYFITQGVLRKTAGLIQIRHYAEAVNDDVLLKLDETMKTRLKDTKKEFYDFLVGDLNYFGNCHAA